MNTQILDCGHPPTNPHESLTNGFGTNDKGKTSCYQCCAAADINYMNENGKITPYLNTLTRTISNWPGSLKFKTGPISKGHHNIARHQYTPYFNLTDDQGINHNWIARMYGDNTQIAHCKKLKT